MKRIPSRLARSVFAASMVAWLVTIYPSPVLGANKTWDGGGADNLWSTARNWDLDTAPAPNDALIFTGTTRLINTNDFAQATTFNGISFNSPPAVGTFTLWGNAVTLGGDIADN